MPAQLHTPAAPRGEGVDSPRLWNSRASRHARNASPIRGNKLTDIAYEQGYAEVASFTRTFRRWTGFARSEFPATAVRTPNGLD